MNTIPPTSRKPHCSARSLGKLPGKEMQKSPAIKAGLLNLTIAYLAIVGVSGIGMIRHVANTRKLGNALH